MDATFSDDACHAKRYPNELASIYPHWSMV